MYERRQKMGHLPRLTFNFFSKTFSYLLVRDQRKEKSELWLELLEHQRTKCRQQNQDLKNHEETWQKRAGEPSSCPGQADAAANEADASLQSNGHQ